MPNTSRTSDEDDSTPLRATRLDNGATAASSSMALDHHYARPSTTGTRYKVLVACLFLFTTFLAWLVASAFNGRDPWEATKCRMAYMSPGYLRLDGLNASHSRLAGKYSLWLYREQGWDLSNKPHGVPVLFAPGNAGSYRQIRSFAAAAARQYYASPGKPHSRLLAANHQELDFFAADFNEDFSAFHAGTLKEQAEYLADCVRYIGSLYSDERSAAPTSVIVLAHSMGGIAARYMFLQEGFDAGSVRTLITLSTPHAIPPATFDRRVDRIYHDINTYWRQSFAGLSNPLNNTLCISIAGGIADTMISSDYADLSALVPPSNGFSVMTTSIPTLFSPVDHQAMMWCDQLRQQVISALLRSTDARRNDRAGELDERLAVFKKHLLTGIELQPDIPKLSAETTLAEEEVMLVEGQLTLGAEEAVNERLYALRLTEASSRRVQVTVAGSGVDLEYYVCQGSANKQCRAVEAPPLVEIPSENMSPANSAPAKNLPLVFSDLAMPDFATHCLIRLSKGYGSIVQLHSQATVREEEISLIAMYLFGWQFDSKTVTGLPSGTVFRFPRLDTSLIVFMLDISTDDSTAQSTLVSAGLNANVTCLLGCSEFIPTVRVSSGGTFESHFFSGNVEKASIHLHSGAPYLPPGPRASNGISLQYWHVPACPIKIRLSVNRKASFGTIVTRYRSIIAAWPTFILLGAMRHFPLAPNGTGKSLSNSTFGDSLKVFLLFETRWWTAAAIAIGLVQAFLLHFRLVPELAANLLLGTRHLLLLALAPAFLAVVATIVLLSQVILYNTVQTLAKIWRVTTPRPGINEDPGEERSLKRLFAFGFLSLFVLVFAPHQFAILSLFLMQGITTVWAYARSPSSTSSAIGANYGALFVLLWLLPQNGAILVVWLRNLQAGWWKPFPSDHNIFAILGPLLLVEHLSSGKELRIPQNRWVISATEHFLTIGMFVVLLWGGRFVYVVGETVNLYFLWLALLQYESVRKYL